jgi:geranylgeranyl pyrophosphate synthase
MTATERERVRALMADPEPRDEIVGDVIGLVHARGGVEAARGRAAGYAERAAEQLDAVPPSRARAALEDCLTYAVERRS